MKYLLNIACLTVLLSFLSCSEKQKSNEIWLKVSDEVYADYDEFALIGDYKKKGEWYVIKMAREDIKNDYVLSDKSMSFHPSILWREYITEVRLPSSITKIDDYAFWRFSGLKNLNIPSNVSLIGEGAFESCHSLEIIELPYEVVKIGHGAFKWCSSLQKIRIPLHIRDLGGVSNDTFEGCPNPKIEWFSNDNHNSGYEDDYTQYADYSWIVGTWSCTTPYGTMTLKFEGDGSSGSCAELTYGSYNYGRYSVKDGVLRYKLNGESLTNVIEIHDSNMLYFGDGYYLHKN